MRSTRFARASVALLTTVAMLAVACGGTEDGGDGSADAEARVDAEAVSSDEEIVVGVHGPKTGPAAALAAGVFDGFHLYLDRLNEAGGVAGRSVRVHEVDDEYSVAGGASAAAQLQDDSLLVMNLLGADPAIGASRELDRAGVPYLTIALPLEQIEALEHAFFIGTPLEYQAAALPSFILNELDGGERTVAVMWENHEIIEDMYDHFVEAAGEAELEIVETVVFERQAASYVPDVQRVRDVDADLVVLLGGISVPGILQAAESLNYSPEWTGTGAWINEQMNIQSGGLMEGIEAVTAAPTDSPEYAEFLELLHVELGQEPGPADELAFVGWSQGQFLEELLVRASEDLTREGVIAALEASEGTPFEIAGFPPSSFGPDRRWGSDQVLRATVIDGTWTTMEPWVSRF